MRILALVESTDHVCCRYRIRAFNDALERFGAALTIQPLQAGWLARESQMRAASGFDVVLLQRRLLPAWTWHTLRSHAKRLVFDFDDAVFHRDSYHPRGLNSNRRRRRFERIVRQSDAVIAGNSFLHGCAARAGADSAKLRVIPTCIEPERYPRATHSRVAADGLRLTWIGSSSTLQGLEHSRDLWCALGAQFPALRLRMVSDRHAEFPPLAIDKVIWSAATETDELAQADVGIAWMPDDDWSRGKCGLKLLQYMAAGLPVVANRVGVHREMVQHGVTGFLADSPREWVDAIDALGNPKLRRSLGAAARLAVEQCYSVVSWAPEFVAALLGRSVSGPHAMTHAPIPLASSNPPRATGCLA